MKVFYPGDRPTVQMLHQVELQPGVNDDVPEDAAVAMIRGGLCTKVDGETYPPEAELQAPWKDPNAAEAEEPPAVEPAPASSPATPERPARRRRNEGGE